MKAKIRYLYHSGFAVETENHTLVFDYWKDTPRGGGLEEGVIDPAQWRDRDVIVFASHAHGDHYNRAILSWKEAIPRLRLVLSDDIPAVPGAHMVGPNQTLTQPDMTVKTYASTDEGVAFLVEVDGLRIYHAGDLNWWHWAGESDGYNREMAAKYKEQIGLLAQQGPIDIAFVPVDPRLEDAYARGILHLMETAEVRCAVPMHFSFDTSAVDRLLADPLAAPYRERILPLTKQGQSAQVI